MPISMFNLRLHDMIWTYMVHYDMSKVQNLRWRSRSLMRMELEDFEFENGPDSSEIIQADKTEIVWKMWFHNVVCGVLACFALKIIITICWTLSSRPEPLFPPGPQQSQLILAILLGRAKERKKLRRHQKISLGDPRIKGWVKVYKLVKDVSALPIFISVGSWMCGLCHSR